MAKRKYSLRFDSRREKWVLMNDTSEKILRIFDTKEEATSAGVLRKALGRQGGIVTLRTREGVFDEERTFPGATN